MSKLVEDTIKLIQTLDKKSMAIARARQDTLTKPLGSLGRLEELSIQIAGIQAKSRPQIKHKSLIVMVADHGVVVMESETFRVILLRQL